MLRLESTTGSMELLPEQERSLRAMSDADVCRALNRGRDPWICAVLKERPQIQFHPGKGWDYHPAHVQSWQTRGLS